MITYDFLMRVCVYTAIYSLENILLHNFDENVSLIRAAREQMVGVKTHGYANSLWEHNQSTTYVVLVNLYFFFKHILLQFETYTYLNQL